MTVIFPLLQSQITDPSQDIPEIYILPHEPLQLEPYNNSSNTVLSPYKSGDIQTFNNSLLNFTMCTQNVTALYNLTANDQSKFISVNDIHSKIYKVSDEGRVIANIHTAESNGNQPKGFSVSSPSKHNSDTRNTRAADFESDEKKMSKNVTHRSGVFRFAFAEKDPNYVLTANELELNPDYEITADLKNYATVNVLEPIPTQISYNIGTENVDADEPLKNTESVALEESSIISEIENPINIFNTINDKDNLQFNDENFNSLFTKPKSAVDTISQFLNSKSNDLIDLNKQIRTTEAIEMSLVCEEEVPSQWVDVMSLASSQNSADLYEPSLLNENPLSAIPTSIQSYIDIKNTKNTTYDGLYLLNNENYNFSREQTEKEIEGVINETIKEINAQKELLNTNASIKYKENTKTRNTDENILKNLTAEANICTCVECKCGPENSCNQEDTCYTKNTVVQSTKPKEQNCCNKSVSCNCSGKADTECCVMVCLKSLDQLRHVLSLANKCCSLQSIAKNFSNSAGCCKK